MPGNYCAHKENRRCTGVTKGWKSLWSGVSGSMERGAVWWELELGRVRECITLAAPCSCLLSSSVPPVDGTYPEISWQREPGRCSSLWSQRKQAKTQRHWILQDVISFPYSIWIILDKRTEGFPVDTTLSASKGSWLLVKQLLVPASNVTTQS